MHAKTLWLALQPMKIKTRDIQCVWRLGGIDGIKAPKCPLCLKDSIMAISVM